MPKPFSHGDKPHRDAPERRFHITYKITKKIPIAETFSPTIFIAKSKTLSLRNVIKTITTMNGPLRLMATLMPAACALHSGAATPIDTKNIDPNRWVEVTEVIPDAILDIRYYGDYNFVGTRIDGYEEPVALLTHEAADALKAAADELREQGYRIKIYDTYRPQCAVDHFVRWAADTEDTKMKQHFYPSVDKRNLFKLQYIAKHSGHSRGSTVDLTLVDITTGEDVDMGGTFDWFGKESHPDFGGNPTKGRHIPTKGITETQWRNRLTLRKAMLRHGFKPISSEWWHFTLKNEPFPKTYFNFPVRHIQR